MSKEKIICLVPVEPTADMVIAGEDAWDAQLEKRLFAKDNGEAFATYPSEETHELCSRVAYRAMLAAAPEVESRQFSCWAVYDSEQGFIKMDADNDCLALFDTEKGAAALVRTHPGTAYKKLVLYYEPQPAPAVQGEPVAWHLRTPEGRVILNKEFPAWADGGDGYKITPLYTAPPPAEQRPAPDVTGLVQQHHRDSAELRRLCQARDEQRDGRLAALERAAKAEADVAALAEALELMVTTHDEGGWPTAAVEIARAALAAYRKGGDA